MLILLIILPNAYIDFEFLMSNEYVTCAAVIIKELRSFFLILSNYIDLSVNCVYKIIKILT